MVHFDVLLPLLNELRQWAVTLILMKVKSHTGFLHIESAYERAGLGYKSEKQELCPDPKNMALSGYEFVLMFVKRLWH